MNALSSDGNRIARLIERADQARGRAAIALQAATTLSARSRRALSSSDKVESAVASCVATCRTCTMPYEAFETLAKWYATSAAWSADELSSLRRSFTEAMPGPTATTHSVERTPASEVDRRVSPKVLRHCGPCLEHCLRTDEPFVTLVRIIARLIADPTWSDDDRTELRVRVSQALLERSSKRAVA